jgi:hypothetical protein
VTSGAAVVVLVVAEGSREAEGWALNG